jgi:hypothetical protein
MRHLEPCGIIRTNLKPVYALLTMNYEAKVTELARAKVMDQPT